MQKQKYWAYAFLIAGSAGALFVLFGLVQVWRARAGAVIIAADTLEVTLETLQATEEGLGVIQDLIETTSNDVSLLESSVQTLTISIENSNQVLDSLIALTGTDLPATIAATQTSLASAQASAALIDDILRAMAGIPLLGLGAYQPEVPINVALGEISDSLNPINPSLESISANLDDTSANLETLRKELARVTETTEEISASLAGAREVIAEYQSITDDLTERAERIRDQAPGAILGITWLLTILLLALLFPQVGLAERGLALLREAGEEIIDPAETTEGFENNEKEDD